MAKIDAHNPLSTLLDIDFPDIKRSNWNCSYDFPTTADVGYVNVVHVDRVLANTDVDFDINHASFANPTVSPLYGRYRVKYLAFWAPDRLYMAGWRNGSKMTDDNYPYPVLLPDLNIDEDPDSPAGRYAGNSMPIVPPTSLAHQLGVYPAYFQPRQFYPKVPTSERQTAIEAFTSDINFDYPSPSNAFSFLAFWDIYRNYILNTQEPEFPIRQKAFVPATTNYNLTESVDRPAFTPSDLMIRREDLDTFFDQITMRQMLNPDQHVDVVQLWMDAFRYDPICSSKLVDQINPIANIDSSDARNMDNYVYRPMYHYSLPLAPLAPDAYTSWISNENVELERQKSAMNVENGKILMESWIVASRISNKVRKMLFKQNGFADYIDVQYGVRPRTDSTIPTFLGAFISDIVFNDVVSTTQLSESADPQLNANRDLGSRAGYGRGTDGGKSNFVRFRSLEPGTFMVLQMIIPDVHYFEGRDPMYDKQNFNEEFNPEFDGIGYQDLQKGHLNMVPQLAVDPLGRWHQEYDWSAHNTPVGQQPYAMEHMTKVNKLGGMFVMPTEYLSWALGRSFNYNRGTFETQTQQPARSFYSTYIFPEMYTNIFKSNVEDNFQFYLSFDYKKYQPISKQFLAFHS